MTMRTIWLGPQLLDSDSHLPGSPLQTRFGTGRLIQVFSRVVHRSDSFDSHRFSCDTFTDSDSGIQVFSRCRSFNCVLYAWSIFTDSDCSRLVWRLLQSISGADYRLDSRSTCRLFQVSSRVNHHDSHRFRLANDHRHRIDMTMRTIRIGPQLVDSIHI